MIIVHTPSGQKSVCDYTLQVLIEDFLGLEWRHEVTEGDSFTISLEGQVGRICLPDIFFQKLGAHWLTADNLPSQPLFQWDSRELSVDIPLVDPLVPVIFGETPPKGRIDKDFIKLPIDILGSAFFMLTRYEEVIKPERDEHSRFPAHASLAYQEGFLERPIIDEYVEILWAAMHRLWPQLQRKQRTRTLRVTCDVDSPYQLGYSNYAMLRGVATDLIKRRSFSLALSDLRKRWRARRGDFSDDTHLANIDWMMDVNERVGNQVAFYFLTGGNHSLDANYRLDEPIIRKLLNRIYERGHEIGLHLSYDSYICPEQTCREADILRLTLEGENIPYAEMGGRQHYLRWQTPITARNLESAGMTYDSTLSYADHPGFRCGTCREFIMYDIEERRQMKLKQRPLAVMETTVVAGHYMDLGYSHVAQDYMMKLKERALSISGEFTLLWHNCSFEDEAAKAIYKVLIQ